MNEKIYADVQDHVLWEHLYFVVDGNRPDLKSL